MLTHPDYRDRAATVRGSWQFQSFAIVVVIAAGVKSVINACKVASHSPLPAAGASLKRFLPICTVGKIDNALFVVAAVVVGNWLQKRSASYQASPLLSIKSQPPYPTPGSARGTDTGTVWFIVFYDGYDYFN